MMNIQLGKSTCLTLIALATLAGCAVGPDFKKPQAPANSDYPALVGPANAQIVASDKDIPAQWWKLYQSPSLDALVDEALKRNPTIESAQAALVQAREATSAQGGYNLPSISANLTPTRQQVAPVLASPLSSGLNLYSLHTAQLNISYTPDLFGNNRRQIESLQAQEEVQQFQLEAARISLETNVVSAAIQTAALKSQIAATQDLIKAQMQVLDAFQRQLQLGQVSRSEVLAQQTQLAQTRATLPPLQKQWVQQRDMLAALTGHLPHEAGVPECDFESFKLAEPIPVSLPSKLVQQRPDVRTAEAQLHSASAQVGVATANRLPNLQLSAALGGASTSTGSIFKEANRFWSLSGSLTQPLFDGGTLKHRQKGAEAALNQADAEYRNTVLSAFQNVADSLQALSTDTEASRLSKEADELARQSLNIAQQQHKLGDISALAVITAEQVSLQARLTAISAEASRLSDAAALIQALGGGWWNQPEH